MRRDMTDGKGAVWISRACIRNIGNLGYGCCMTDQTLIHFVKEGLESGQSRSAMTEALVAAGWRPGEIESAMNQFADVSFPIAVPRPQPYLSAREAFLYLFFFILLGIVSYSLGSLFYGLIDVAFRDPLEASEYRIVRNQSQIRSAISGLVVGLPIFLYLAHILRKARRTKPELQRSRIRKWLTYLSLVVAGCTLVGDATSLIYNLLSGELTITFLLKSLVVAVIAGAIFAYFIRDAERGDALDQADA